MDVDVKDKTKNVDKEKAKLKAKEISKKPTNLQNQELDRVFSNSLPEGVAVLKELILLAKEDGASVSQANKELLDFYSKELDRINEIILDGKVSEDEIKTLIEMKKDIVDKGKHSSERTQDMKNEAKKETTKAVIKETGKVLTVGLITAGVLKLTDMIIQAVKNKL